MPGDSSIQQNKELREFLREHGIVRLGCTEEHDCDPIEALAEFLQSRDDEIARNARIDEHRNWVLPNVEAAHQYEQQESGSGIQYFDNERLGRLEELSS